jgi:ribosomal protein S18 acetylase RimI-like enzyme
MSIEHVFASIRPYRNGDRKALPCPSARTSGTSDTRAWPARGCRHILGVATAGESVVGFVSVQFHDWNGLAQLHGLSVDPRHARRGIGTQLVDVTYVKFFGPPE